MQMKKALISYNEPVKNGFRVAQVESAENIFPVAEGLEWVDCADDVVADVYFFNAETNAIELTGTVSTTQPISTGTQPL